MDWDKANREGPRWKHHPTEWDIASWRICEDHKVEAYSAPWNKWAS